MPPTYVGVWGMNVPGGAGTLSTQPSQTYAVCSWACFDRWTSIVFAQGQQPSMNGEKYMLAGIVLYPTTAQRAAQLYNAYRTKTGLDRAAKMIQAEDFEGAAHEYEALGMWDQAAMARHRDHRVTEVQVNVNQLIEQLKASGVSTDYTCPTCGSHIPISGETNLTTLTTCTYCGSVIRMTDLVDFLTKVVGHA